MRATRLNLLRRVGRAMAVGLIAASIGGSQVPALAAQPDAAAPSTLDDPAAVAPVTYYIQPAAAPAPSPAAVAAWQVTPTQVTPAAVPSVTAGGPQSAGPWRLTLTPAAALSGRRGLGGIDLFTTSPTPHASAIGGNLAYNGGPVERTGSSSFAIFWQPTGTFMSTQYQPLLTRYMRDVGGSSLYGLATQYSDGGGNIQNTSSLGGTWQDSSAYPSSLLFDSDIVNEVLNAINTNNWTPSSDANFFVYTARGEGECAFGVCFGQAGGFCGYHNAFQASNGVQTFIIRYSFVGYIDGSVLQGCGPGAPYPNGDGSSDIGIKVTSHEQMEMVTDPEPSSGWVDSVGQEIGDKCNTTFGPRNAQGSDANLNGNPYLVQEFWSNTISNCALSLQTPPTFALNVAIGGNGSGSVTSVPAGISCGATCATLFPSGTIVALTATPGAGSTFAGWSGACAGLGQCVVTMNAALAVTANFTAVVCSPRPPIHVSATRGAPGTLNVSITVSGSNDTLQSVQLGNPATVPAVPVNGAVDIAGQSGLVGPTTVQLPSGTTQINLVVHRAAGGAATTVPLVVTDSCGAWPTLVGGGPGAF